MSRVTAIVITCLLATPGFAQRESRYHSSEWHFSFLLPEGWEYITEDALPSEYRKTLRNQAKSKALAVCQRIGAEYFTTPYILVLVRSLEEMSEVEVEKFFGDDREFLLDNLERMIDLIQKGKSLRMLESWKGAERIGAEVDYHPDKHASFETVELYHQSLGRIIAVTVKLLGSHRMVTLKCYADGPDADNFLDLVKAVEDSFAYDKGYGFKETKGVAPGLIQGLLRKGITSWIVGLSVIALLCWLLRRWAMG